MAKLNVIVNGSGGVGKDTFVDFVIEELATQGIKASKFSSVECVKTAMTHLGWCGAKTVENRKIMSDLKDLSTKMWNGPLKSIEKYLKDTDDSVVFFMIREPEEIQKFKDIYPNTLTLLIKRDGIEKFDNHADLRVDFYTYDDTIVNTSLEIFRQKAIDYAGKLNARAN